MCKAFLILLVSFPLFLSGQNFNSKQFEERVQFSADLLDWPPESDIRIKEILPKGFTIDLTDSDKFKYRFKDPQGNRITAYLHIENSNVVYVEFTEGNASFIEIQKFLTEEKGFEWVGAEHQWNYFNNKKLSIAISPEMTVHVSRYDL